MDFALCLSEFVFTTKFIHRLLEGLAVNGILLLLAGQSLSLFYRYDIIQAQP